jgi:drug/metabolite transporter (DMT)-like permease
MPRCPFALIHIPLADATAVIFAAPALTVALAALWLGERVSARRWLGVAIGLRRACWWRCAPPS